MAATLHELGWEVALDDVGANDAGIALLPVLRPDVVKLDMGLLAPRSGRSERQVLDAVEAYVASTGAHVVAEGIEDEDRRRRAVEIGADWGQGWLFGRPAPLPARTAGAAMPRPARAQAREGADPRVRTDPFLLLGRDRCAPVTATTEAAVVAQVRDACLDALTLSGGSLVVVSLGRAELAPAGLADLLSRLRDVCALVVLLAGEPGVVADRAVRTTALADGDPLGADATVVLLAPERALAFHARQAADGSWTSRSTRTRNRSASRCAPCSPGPRRWSATPSSPLSDPGGHPNSPAARRAATPINGVRPEEVPVDADPSLLCAPVALDPSPVMGLLHDRLPLTLLLDLALGVRSDEVYASEPADVSWVPTRVA